MIRTCIIDDHTLFRSCLKDYLAKQSDISVELDLEDPTVLLEKLERCKIDIVIVDLFMPKMAGEELVKLLKNRYPTTKIIVLSMCTELKEISNLIDQGIHSYISKADNIEDLVRAIHAVSEDKIFRNKLFTEALYWHSLQNAGKNSNGKNIQFSERDKKVLQLLWEEKNNKQIANELFLGVRSIEKIRQDMKERLGVKTIIGLLKYALTHRLILEPDNNKFLSGKKVLNSSY